MDKYFKNYVHYTDPETGAVTRFEPGDKCPKHLVNVIDSNNFKRLEDDPENDELAAMKESRINYKSLGKEDLVVLAADRGLSPEGTKPQLVQRLIDHDNAQR